MSPEQIQESQRTLGFSVTRMARELGVARGTYDKWQRGDQKISASGEQGIRFLLFLNDRGLIEKFHDFCAARLSNL